MYTVIPEARALADAIGDPNHTGTLLRGSLLNAIGTAFNTQSKSCTLSVSGQKGSDVLPLIKELMNAGYLVTQIGTNLTIKWA